MILNDIPKAIPIKKIVQENPHVKTFVFEHTLNSQPGQFVNLWIPRVDEKPMSIANDTGKEFWITMFAVGPFSRMMHHLKVGDLVGVRGPYGKPFTFKPKQHLVMMAGGYGAAPLYNLSVKAIKEGCKIDFVIGARSEDYLLYLDRVKKLPGVKLHVTTDDGSVGRKGFNTLVLQELVGKKKIENRKKEIGVGVDCVYACGPEMMMKAISNICDEAKVDAQISIERYMKCGFGVCGQCSVDPRGQPVCIEGPCVSNETARKIVEFGKYHRDKIGKMHQF